MGLKIGDLVRYSEIGRGKKIKEVHDAVLRIVNVYDDGRVRAEFVICPQRGNLIGVKFDHDANEFVLANPQRRVKWQNSQ